MKSIYFWDLAANIRFINNKCGNLDSLLLYTDTYFSAGSKLRHGNEEAFIAPTTGIKGHLRVWPPEAEGSLSWR